MYHDDKGHITLKSLLKEDYTHPLVDQFVHHSEQVIKELHVNKVRESTQGEISMYQLKHCIKPRSQHDASMHPPDYYILYCIHTILEKV